MEQYTVTILRTDTQPVSFGKSEMNETNKQLLREKGVTIDIQVNRGGTRSFWEDISFFPQVHDLRMWLSDDFVLAAQILEVITSTRRITIRLNNGGEGIENFFAVLVRGSHNDIWLTSHCNDNTLRIFATHLEESMMSSITRFHCIDMSSKTEKDRSCDHAILLKALTVLPNLNTLFFPPPVAGESLNALEKLVLSGKLRRLSFMPSDPLPILKALCGSQIASVQILGAPNTSEVKQALVELLSTTPSLKVIRLSMDRYDEIVSVLEEQNSTLLSFLPKKSGLSYKRLYDLLQRNKALTVPWSLDLYSSLPRRSHRLIREIMGFSYYSKFFSLLPRELLYLIFFFLV